jgi:uncharacterized repeat protein (TIGR03837 family)
MTPRAPTLTWDIFCHVIDNWGDLGVCWRLTADLASRGQRVRLWVDDPAPLEWMAPGALQQSWRGVTVYPWARHTGAAASNLKTNLPPGDVLIEAFGCEIPPEWVRQLHLLRSDPQPVWINLEYLSAEPWVERCHGLPSPVLSGPLAGRTKWFFYPGFTAQTGGLLREEVLMSRPRETQALPTSTNGFHAGDGPRVTLFCYEPERLPDLLHHPDLCHAHWQVAPGRATAAFHAAVGATPRHLPPGATVTLLPHTPQPAFDDTLWTSDLNLVRGEDSLVRALWAGQAFVWQIYPQDDDAHHAKLDAFLDWLGAPADWRQMHHVWNGMSTAALPALGHATLQRWRETACAARQRLLEQDDLTTQLVKFVLEKQ